jgi:hypothetical protein
MPDRTSYRQMSDDELAELIGSLPRREPDARLRDRTLAHAAGARGAARSLRPALAFAVLALLVASDALVMSWQDRALTADVSVRIVAESPQSADIDRLHWPRGLRLSVADLEAAFPAAGQAAALDSYLRLRKQLANGA